MSNSTKLVHPKSDYEIELEKEVNELRKSLELERQIANVYLQQARTFSNRLHFSEITVRNLQKQLDSVSNIEVKVFP